MIPRAGNHTLAALSLANTNQTAAAFVDGQTEYWMNRQQDLPTFAEYRDPVGVSQPSAGRSVQDTGVVLRAFIPFGNASARTTIKTFEGVATVLDSRVVASTQRSIRVCRLLWMGQGDG